MTFFTGDKVSKADGGEGDDDEVDGLQRAPALDVLEDDDWQGHEDEAPEQDEEQRGEDADLCLADFPLLRGDKRIVDMKNGGFQHTENQLFNETSGNERGTLGRNETLKAGEPRSAEATNDKYARILTGLMILYYMQYG